MPSLSAARYRKLWILCGRHRTIKKLQQKGIEKMKKKSLGIIHAAIFTANTIQPFADKYIPDVEILHCGDCLLYTSRCV